MALSDLSSCFLARLLWYSCLRWKSWMAVPPQEPKPSLGLLGWQGQALNPWSYGLQVAVSQPNNRIMPLTKSIKPHCFMAVKTLFVCEISLRGTLERSLCLSRYPTTVKSRSRTAKRSASNKLMLTLSLSTSATSIALLDTLPSNSSSKQSTNETVLMFTIRVQNNGNFLTNNLHHLRMFVYIICFNVNKVTTRNRNEPPRSLSSSYRFVDTIIRLC